MCVAGLPVIESWLDDGVQKRFYVPPTDWTHLQYGDFRFQRTKFGALGAGVKNIH